MSSSATDPIGGRPARPKPRAGAAGVLGLLLFVGNIFLWPIFFDLVSGLGPNRFGPDPLD
jgi:hypothetical protein